MSSVSIHPGFPIVLSSPSGGGKSTIADHVLAQWPQAIRSISCTTRSPRPGEVHGQHYFFISPEEFQKKIKQEEFVEWALVHDRYYGTPKTEFEMNMKQGRDVLLVIDPQGALSIRKKYPNGLFIFIVPPTWDDLVARLSERGTDTKEERARRLANAKIELAAISHYDFLVVNDDLESAVGDVVAIIRSEHRRLNRVNKRDIPILSDDKL